MSQIRHADKKLGVSYVHNEHFTALCPYCKRESLPPEALVFGMIPFIGVTVALIVWMLGLSSGVALTGGFLAGIVACDPFARFFWKRAQQ